MVGQLGHGGPGSALRLVTLSRIQLTLSSLVTEVQKLYQFPSSVELNFLSLPLVTALVFQHTSLTPCLSEVSSASFLSPGHSYSCESHSLGKQL